MKQDDSGRCPQGPRDREVAGQRRHLAHKRPAKQIFDIFEGTEQIPQLVISRAITGLRVE
jgi:hypothetical protein